MGTVEYHHPHFTRRGWHEARKQKRCAFHLSEIPCRAAACAQGNLFFELALRQPWSGIGFRQTRTTTKRSVWALNGRIGLALLLIVIASSGIWMGWLHPHKVGQ